VDKPRFHAAVALPPGRALAWRAMMAEELAAASVVVSAWRRPEATAGKAAAEPGADPGLRPSSPAPGGFMGTPGPDVPYPWRALLPAERMLERPKPDLFATVENVPFASGGSGPADILVLTPGSVVPESVLAGLPWGALVIEPVHPDRFGGVPYGSARPDASGPDRFGPGFLEGRVLWRRRGHAPRLAFTTYTSVEGPAPHSWARPHFAKLAAAPARIVARIAREGEACWDACPPAVPQTPYAPGLKDLAVFAARFVRWGLRRAISDLLMRRQWFLAVRPGDGDPARPGFASQPFTPLHPPKGTGWADPFLFTHRGRDWLFIEEIPGRSKGVISVMERQPGGSFGPPRRVLAEPFHLSYPNVFEHEGRIYMVPESAQANQARLYRATDFPGGWALDRVLMDGLPLTDATFLSHGGKWWMFASVRPHGGSSWDELHLFVSEDRLGPYRPHPANPVVSDVRRSRPAGRVFGKNGRLYRPAQDCSGCYGRALGVMEITLLTETAYEEREAARLEPDLIPGSFCLHTLEARQGLEIVDGQRFVPLWR
jgi:hypothetical protein